MSVGVANLGAYITARFTDGSVAFSGQMVIYCDSPMVGVNCPDGTQRHWRADMCEVSAMPPQRMDEAAKSDGSVSGHDPATCWHCQHGM